MKLLLEADFQSGEIRFSRENEDGFIYSQFPIGTIESPNIQDVLVMSADIASNFGWVLSDDWKESESGVIMWAYVKPTPAKVSFISAETVTSETAISYAEMAGFKVVDILDQELVPDEGKVVVTLDLAEPRGWSYDGFFVNEPFIFDEEPFGN